MKNEWRFQRRLRESFDYLVDFSERMHPAELVRHLHRKARSEHLLQVWIVMRNRGDTAEEIADASPPQARFPRNAQAFRDTRFFGTVDVRSPFAPTRIR